MPFSGANDTPMLTVFRISCSLNFTGKVRVAATRCANDSASSLPEIPFCTTTNSSPPSLGHDVVRSDRREKALGKGLEQKIPCIVTKRIVHLFEAIEVDKVHGEIAASRQQDGKIFLQLFD